MVGWGGGGHERVNTVSFTCSIYQHLSHLLKLKTSEGKRGGKKAFLVTLYCKD